MATISPNDSAPAETVHYTFATSEFDLGGSTASYETDDPTVIAEAIGHPWLTVEVPVPEVVQGDYVEGIRPEDDPMSWMNSVANNPEAARKAEEQKDADEVAPVAIQPAVEQTEESKVGPVAQTVASTPRSKTSDKVKD